MSTEAYIAQCVKEEFDKRLNGDLDARLKAYIDECIDKKFEAIKANVIPERTEPNIQIVSDTRTTCDFSMVNKKVLYIQNSGHTGAKNVSITVPEDEKERILPSVGKEELDLFELKEFDMPAGSSYTLCELKADSVLPRKFHLNYQYDLQNGKTEYKEIKVLVVQRYADC